MLMNATMIKRFKLEVLSLVLAVVKQLLRLEPEKRAELLADLESAVATGDLTRLPPEIEIKV